MTKNLQDPQRIMRHLVWPVALAAVAVAGCSTSAGSTAGHPASGTPVTSTVTVAPTPMQAPAPGQTPTVTVTVTPPPAAAPAPVVQPANGPATFRSPSGDINCTLSTPGGEIEARCEVVDHAWSATSPPDCHMNWGDRVYLRQGGNAGFGCYGQEFPVGETTLAYGQALSLGTITCESEAAGMTCTDGSTGHYFRVSRESYELG
jgi:hypothetical protein